MKIAVIGGGISGLASGVILSQAHEVHLFEAAPRLGGHAHTVNVDEGGRSIPMDTGFLVFNTLTYPHLTGFLEMLGVETVDSDMSLSIQIPKQKIEWNGTNLNTIFAQRKNFLRPSFYRMLFEILRFHRHAEEYLALAKRHAWTLGELVSNQKFAPVFRDNYLLPMGAAIWSTPEKQMMDYPAATFLNFFLNHKLLQVNERPIWRTIKNGSIQYVEKARKLISHIHIDSEVLSVERKAGGVWVKTRTGDFHFDRVVMATHAPITARLLKAQSAAESQILSAFRVEANSAILHGDHQLMPQTKRAWASWNIFSGAAEKISLSYHLNKLQPLQTEKDYILTLNPHRKIQNNFGEYNYDHPLFNQAAIRAQRELPSIQGQGGVYFAGAWTRYGFHEDGILSAVRVAELMGIKPPWRTS